MLTDRRLHLLLSLLCYAGAPGCVGAEVDDASPGEDSDALTAAPDNRYCLAGNVTHFANTADGPAALPTRCLYTPTAATPSPAGVITVPAGGDLQGALNAASCGQIIQLAGGATYTGHFTVPAKHCDAAHWITVRTSQIASLPPEGNRLTPCYSGVGPGTLWDRPHYACGTPSVFTAKIVTTDTNPALSFADGADHYRFIGLEITRTAGHAVYVLVSAADTASNLIFDRVWVHGTKNDDTAHGIALSGTTGVAIIDSYLNDFHCESVTGSCTDAQAIAGGLGSLAQGNYKIVNNFLEASGQSVLFGGGAATTTPSDIEVRRNNLFKPMTWMKGNPTFVGGTHGNPFIVKNHFELKNGARVLYEANVAENCWGGYSQSGFSLLLTAKNQNNVCPLCKVTDVTVRNSTFSHLGGGMQLANVPSDAGGLAADGARFSVHDVTIDDVSATKYFGGAGVLFTIMNAFTVNPLRSISIDHVTAFGDPLKSIMWVGNDLSNPDMSNIHIDNNIFLAPKYPVWSSGGGPTNCAAGDVPLTTFDACFAPYSFAKDVLVGAATPSQWPAGTLFAASPADVDFVNYANAVGGDYRLCRGAGVPAASCTRASPYLNIGTDGRDLGANVTAIATFISGVR
jgi:hypothetical protein